MTDSEETNFESQKTNGSNLLPVLELYTLALRYSVHYTLSQIKVAKSVGLFVKNITFLAI